MIAIVYNTRAGRHRSGHLAARVRDMLDAKGIACTLFGDPWPETYDQFSSVWVIGGDGTLNYLVNHAKGPLPPLAIFSGGTGNDLSSLLYGNLSVEEMVEKLLHASPRPVDAGCCNGRYFLNMCGLGFDGEVLKSMSTIRWMGSFLGYYAAIVKTIFSYREPKFRISVNGKDEAGHSCLILMASNAPTTGGGFRVSPRASITDGALDLIMISRLPVLKRLVYLPRVRKGEHLGLPFVQHQRFRTLRVSSDHALRAQLDGELIMEKEFEISVVPGKFSFLY